MKPYEPPSPFPKGQTVAERIAEDQNSTKGEGDREFYQPVRHEGTGVDEEEAMYESSLVTIEEARKLLRKSSAMCIIDKGWECIQLRIQMEHSSNAPSS
jgi:hypothetical protein